MEFVAATNNDGKLSELVRILNAMGHTVKSQKEMGIDIEPNETGVTFKQNSLIKAKIICEACKLPTIADDSGLCVPALGGEPGVYSARYCGRHGDDNANNDKLLQKMAGLDGDKREAQFVSAVTVYLPGGAHITAKGDCSGIIGYEKRGDNGFGYDPIFYVPQYDMRSYAQLTAEEKDAISHRGKALAELEKMLPEFLNNNEIGIA